MYKRPTLRVREPPSMHTSTIQPGTFLHGIIRPAPTIQYKHEKVPIYNKRAYLSLVKINCEKMGLPYEEPNLPDEVVIETPPIVKHETIDEWDKIYINLKILKNGTVRVKLNTQFYELHENYVSKNKKAPIKAILQAYKSMEFSDNFLKNLLKNYDNKIRFGKRIEKVLDTIFNKEPVKKPKKKKEEEIEEPDAEAELDRDDEQEDDDVNDDDGLDVELEVDDDEVQDQGEEIFFSDEE
jgi:hypothetical protein